MLACALLASACTAARPESPLQAYSADSPPAIRIIALMPIENGPATPQAAQLVQDTLAAHLARRYEIVRYQRRPDSIVQQPGLGIIHDLLDARRRHGAEAALVGSIIEYRPFEPPSITMGLKLLSTADGSVIWAASGTIDSARPDIEQRIRKYYTHTQRSSASQFGWRNIILAERQYARYVTNEFLLTFNTQRRSAQ